MDTTGVIKSTMLGVEDHGILTAFLHIEGEAWGQGFGGYNLDVEKEASKFIRGVLTALEKEKWEDLPNTPIRIRRLNGRIVAIGHFYKDKWYSPDFSGLFGL